MMNPAEYQVEQIQFFFLMFVRILTMLLIFPIFGSRNVPWQLKVGLSFFLSLALYPIIQPRVVEIPNQLFPYAMLIMKEALVGIIIGFVAALIFTGVSVAGTMIDIQVGFAMARSIDPLTGGNTTVLGQFQIILFTLAFLVMGGHQFLVLALVKSFAKIPIMGVSFHTGKLAQAMAYYLATAFEVGIRLAGPVLIIVLLTSVASGVLARTMPQMNLFVVALPAKITVAVVGLAMALPMMYYVFEKAYRHMQDSIFQMLLLMA